MTAKKKRKEARKPNAEAVISTLLGVIGSGIIIVHIDRFGGDRQIYEEIISLIGILLGLYISSIFDIIIHEAGHLLFGLLSGYKFSSFRIFSYMWIKENEKIKLRKLSLLGTAGQCLMIPPDMKDGKLPLTLYNLGGSIMNIVSGGIFLIGYCLCLHSPFLSTQFLLFAVMAFLSALMNGIPMRMSTVDNDGYNAFALSKNPQAVEAFWIQLKIVEQSAKGLRIKDMPEEWFVFPSDEALKNSMVATRGVFTCNRLMDEEKFKEADELMAHLLEIDSGMIDLHRNLLICDRIYLELIGENRQEVIERMLSQEQKLFMKSMKKFPSVLRTEYALALLFDKDREKAEKIQTQFEKHAKTYPYPHEVDSERDLIVIAKSKIDTTIEI